MYTHVRKQIYLKKGGKINKFQLGGISDYSGILAADENPTISASMSNPSFVEHLDPQQSLLQTDPISPGDISIDPLKETVKKQAELGQEWLEAKRLKEERQSNFAQAMGVDKKYIGDGKGQMSAKGAAVAGGVSQGVVMATNAIDNLAMGDKNFGAQSEAIDAGVHMVSGALMKSGHPIAMAAGAALEGANFLTKAGGQTVQGFDVDINSSGYGNIGHMESSSSRDWGSAIGLGGLSRWKMQKKLARRNEQARMALNAAEIAEDQSFESEARMNSVENTIMNNQIALSGGLQTNLLGS